MRTVCALGRAVVAGVLVVGSYVAASAMDVDDAARLAVETNPVIDQAAANRRAVDSELQQAYGAFLPKLDLRGEYGPEKTDQPRGLSAANNDTWRFGRSTTVTGSLVLFSGFERLNDVYRQQARVEGAALRVLERAELTALRAVEVYLDVIRLRRQAESARTNLNVHRGIDRIVTDRQEGGAATEGEVFQISERAQLADSVLARIVQEVGEAEARFFKVIGARPVNLRQPGVPPTGAVGLEAISQKAFNDNSTLRALDQDIEAAFRAVEATQSLFLPEVSLRGEQTWGEDIDGTPGRNDETAVKLVFSWNLFNGGIDIARRSELKERLGEAKITHEVNRRDIQEIVESSWVTLNRAGARIAALQRRVDASRRLVRAYQEEYELGRRSLLNLLDAQNSLFNSEIELANVINIRVFAAYRLLAASGEILAAMNIQRPVEATRGPAGLFGYAKD